MHSVIKPASVSKKVLWTGRILSGLTAAFLLLDAATHIARIAPVIRAFDELELPVRFALTLGLLEFICVAVYLYPRTSVLGAILLTGYLGGAVAVQLRVGNPLFGETLSPVYVGVLVWGGFFLREPRSRELVPLLTTNTVEKKASDLNLRDQVSVA